MRLFEKVVPQSTSVTSLAFLGETPSTYPPPSRPKGAPSRFSLVAGKEPGGVGSFPVLGYEQVQCATLVRSVLGLHPLRWPSRVLVAKAHSSHPEMSRWISS
jgi:hypothetical protein